eukprot:UN21429
MEEKIRLLFIDEKYYVLMNTKGLGIKSTEVETTSNDNTNAEKKRKLDDSTNKEETPNKNPK